jgi:hypothetical protein
MGRRSPRKSPNYIKESYRLPPCLGLSDTHTNTLQDEKMRHLQRPAAVTAYARFEVLAAVAMKNPVSPDVMSCNLIDRYQHFGGTYCLNLQGRRYF